MNVLLKQMHRIRMIEAEIARRYPEGKMRTPVHLSIGQEAAAVGVCAALRPEDVCVSTHRSHAHYLAKGGNLNALIAELYGKATGCSRGHGGSMHLVDRRVGFLGSTSIVGGTIPIGVGAAFTKHIREEAGISVVFLGDAALEEGVWHESANFAALHRLPVMFVCEDNAYSCYTHSSERRRFGIATHVSAYGMTYMYSDQGVEQIKAYAEQLRTQTLLRGPSFLHIYTDRYLEHCGPNNDDHLRYRNIALLNAVREADPLNGVPEDPVVVTEIQAAFAAAEAAPWPENVSMYAD